MRHYLSILWIIFFTVSISAQAPDTLWTKIFGGTGDDEGRSVQQTTDGGYIIAGTTQSFGANNNDVWLIKTDANGDSLWSRTFSGSGWGKGYSVRQTNDGGYIITGSTFAVDLSDTWLIKTDANGDTLWTKTIGGSDGDGGYSIEQTLDGGYIIVGWKGITLLNASTDLWLIKTDAHGDTLWTKTFGERYRNDRGNSVRQTSDGGYIVTGITNSFGVANSSLWLIKTDNSGDTLWTKTFGDSHYVNEGFSVQQTNDGGYIIAGAIHSLMAGTHDVWLIKTDANGDSLWSRTFGGDGQDQGSSVQQTSDSGYIIVGITDPLNGHYKDFDIYLIKTDANGDTLWTKTFGERYDDDWGFSIGQTMDNGYIITGRTDPYGPIGYNLWLIKVASDITQIGGDFTAIINEYHLLQNSPNPFNPTTTISYQLPVGGKAELSIFNLLGQQIRTIVNSDQPVGEHQVQWDGRDDLGKQVSSGIYFYKLKAGNDFSETKKMILVR